MKPLFLLLPKIHQIVVKAIVETKPDSCACGIVACYDDRIVVHGYGEQHSYMLPHKQQGTSWEGAPFK